VQALTLFGLIPAVVFAPLFILGGVVLYPLLMIGIGDAIGNYEQTNG
jgi:ABC-type Na+ efflux pump permease subunit